MPKDPTSSTIGPTFVIRDYLEATDNAASRTRLITIVMIIATVLIAIGFWNSATWSWATERIKAAYDTTYEDKYKILLSDQHLEQNADKAKFQENLQEHVIKDYIDNVRFIRVPFFGIAFDLNDLGPIGGLSLIIVLLMLRFSLSREIKNLKVSFREAENHGQLWYFYHALAMRQVLTVPEMEGEKQNLWLAQATKLVCVLPLIVFSFGVFYDYWSVFRYRMFSANVVGVTLIVDTVWWVAITFLSWKCWERQSHINEIWKTNWDGACFERVPTVKIDKDLFEFYGSDMKINRILRDLKTKKE